MSKQTCITGTEFVQITHIVKKDINCTLLLHFAYSCAMMKVHIFEQKLRRKPVEGLMDKNGKELSYRS